MSAIDINNEGYKAVNWDLAHAQHGQLRDAAFETWGLDFNTMTGDDPSQDDHIDQYKYSYEDAVRSYNKLHVIQGLGKLGLHIPADHSTPTVYVEGGSCYMFGNILPKKLLRDLSVHQPGFINNEQRDEAFDGTLTYLDDSYLAYFACNWRHPRGRPIDNDAPRNIAANAVVLRISDKSVLIKP